MNQEIWMHRCFELARLGAGNVAPNPMVGSVLVYDNKIIGEGWHQKFGSNHAEVNAINSVKNPDLLPLSTLYVNLEPCAHFGKTPPCANLIIEKKIKKVVIACLDPNPLVAGKGVELLKAAGVEVEIGVLEKEGIELNKRFLTSIEKNRPYVILKWAQTFNGYLSPDARKMSPEQFEEERHITGFLVQKLVHKWRTQEDAIMVATNTALTDNPALNNRAWEGRAPARIVLDQHLRLPKTLKLLDQSQRTFVLNASKNEADGNTEYIQLDFSGNWFKQMLDELHIRKIQSIVVEGGAQLLNTIIENNLWDEAIVFYAPKSISNGIKAPYISGKINQVETIDQMKMTQYINA
ncbi:MAG: bifunctional diaminohydroxyphosphoribosylaminopyrimidine deaminase/5-amino-6-(5-phosphoribosylamino)uracil reductase RibD [Bacteroidia bacterium]|nr:bifunctional diaminohydroxyphosphoribosylaminopyrimidine deaminase/5-amino-6-(5-phosphoribosylamino)uracil reductase RibD [Bacteroidia bacterium]MCF8426116.1 bifunctional diaminohydroxyphosphoribosylaminopyrimidine deaminase/5-amino-6-(5-phosphoribosylamino)uracil reductase RibD [Bacteroidia bacterium]MCF8446492.1 bifunctional diaminohydroxyphosphoribosylaminopyrimidine deaminase/5-amino-6-(5-phosphoribosylamino)uracil reductase RibD [Bacteroidia bacterium]